MNYAAHVAPDPVTDSHSEVDENSPAADTSLAFDTFVSETTVSQTLFNAEECLDPLSAFPIEAEQEEEHEEEDEERATSTQPQGRGWTNAALFVVAALTSFTVALIGSWWSGLVPARTPDTTAVAAPIMSAQDISALRDTSNNPPAELTASLQLGPSMRPSVARIPAAAPGIVPPAAAPSSIPALRPRQMTEPIATDPALETNLVTRAPATIVDAPAVPAPAVQAPVTPPPTPPATAVRPAPAAPAAVAAPSEHSEIERTLAQYRSAYQRLDAEAAQAVWPSVDVRALARAFDTLASQQLAFENCQLEIAGQSATAECRGSATYAPKIGNREPKLEPRQWTFHLHREPEGWKIQSAQTRR